MSHVLDATGVLMREPTPCGTWRSPLTARQVASSVELGRVRLTDDGAVWWEETLPDGPATAVRCRTPDGAVVTAWEERWADLLDGPMLWHPLPGGALVVSGPARRSLRLVAPGRDQHELTAPEGDADETYTELGPGAEASGLYAVRESRREGTVLRQIVAVPLGGGPVRVLHATTERVSTPRAAPDGRHLAWVSWADPQMPWDGSELHVGRIADEGVADVRTLLGGPVESVSQPEWASADSLYVVADRTRWSHLYEVGLDGRVRLLTALAEEFGWPQTEPGLSTYAPLADGRVAVLHGAGEWSLDLLDPADGTLTPLGRRHTAWAPHLDAHGTVVAGVAGGPAEPTAVVTVDVATGEEVVLARSDRTVPAELLPVGHPTAFTARDGHLVHATVFPPHHPEHRAPDGERAPWLLSLRGEVGEQEPQLLDLTAAWFTSRGIGVAVVHPRGTGGHGRDYREDVYGRWGTADVEDCAVVARGLVRDWAADRSRLVVRGVGAAAGATALGVLAATDVCAAAAVQGAATSLAEARGEPGTVVRHLREIAADSVLLRSPVWPDRLDRPVLVCHGELDPVVPLVHATSLVDVLREHGVPHALLAFPGEGHRLRGADAVAAALEAELSFYGQVLGFAPADVAVLRLEPAPRLAQAGS